MGCITSKVITRSSSYQEELNGSFKMRENGFPVLEELLTSKNGGDQLVAALVCNANRVAKPKKLRSGSFASESSTSSNDKLFLEEPMSPETINSWELMAGLEEEQEHSDQRKHQSMLLSSTGQAGPYGINNKRSRSFHLVRKDELSIEGSFVGVEDHEPNRHNQLGFTRSRSFHTLQEYEAMVVDRKRWLKKQEAYSKDPVTNTKVHNSYACGTSSETCCDDEVDQVKYCLREEDEIKEKSLIEESVAVLETNRPAESSDIETKNVLFISCGNSRVNDQVNNVVENVPRTGRFITSEKGSRRKAMAKELTSLSIPSSTIEFPAIGSLREWINGAGEQVYTSEPYVTPKFGSFCLQVPMKRNKCIEDSVFELEMVAAFEQAMQQLEVEEESVLKQIGGDFEEGDITKEKKDV